MNPGGDCSDSTYGFRAGTHPGFVLRVLPAKGEPKPEDYAGVSSWQWPTGMHIVAGFEHEGEFAPDTGLTRRLDIRYYVTSTNSLLDSVWRQSGKVPISNDHLGPQFWFKYYLPDDLGGQRICLSADYESGDFGKLKTTEPMCVSVFRPCSSADTLYIRRDLAHWAYDLRDWLLVITITDSLLKLGAIGLIGLDNASVAAEKLGDYDRALAYLDTCFQRYGTIMPGISGGYLPSKPDTESYSRARDRLLQAKSDKSPLKH